MKKDIIKKNAHVVRKFIDEHPEITADRRRAIVLLHEHPDLFKNIDNARSCVRYVTGCKGDQARREMKNPELTKYFYSTLPDVVTPPEVDTSAFVIPDDIETMAVWNDIHCPWMDRAAVEKALVLSDSDTLYINGDLADFYWLSKFSKDPKMQDRFHDELQKIVSFLLWIRDKFDKIYFKVANHEDRLPHFLSRNASELSGIESLQLGNLLKLDELEIPIVTTARHAEFGDLDIVHGHELRVMGGVNLGISYAKAWQGYKGRMDVRVLFAHHHRFNFGVINNPDGTKAYGYGNACLANRSVGYAPKNSWQHGITRVERSSTGTKVIPIPL